MAVNLFKYFAGTLLVLVIATILSILLVQRSQMVRSNQPTTSGSFEWIRRFRIFDALQLS